MTMGKEKSGPNPASHPSHRGPAQNGTPDPEPPVASTASTSGTKAQRPSILTHLLNQALLTPSLWARVLAAPDIHCF